MHLKVPTANGIESPEAPGHLYPPIVYVPEGLETGGRLETDQLKTGDRSSTLLAETRLPWVRAE